MNKALNPYFFGEDTTFCWYAGFSKFSLEAGITDFAHSHKNLANADEGTGDNISGDLEEYYEGGNGNYFDCYRRDPVSAGWTFTDSYGDNLSPYLVWTHLDFTLEAFIKTTAALTGNQIIFQSLNTLGKYNPRLWKKTDHRIRAQVENSVYNVNGTAVLAADTEYYINFTSESGTMTIYIDNVSDATLAAPVSGIRGTLSVMSVNDVSNPLRQSIKFIRLINGRAMSATERAFSLNLMSRI